jgi:MFS family permease
LTEGNSAGRQPSSRTAATAAPSLLPCRKPLLLIAFGILPIGGVLYTVTSSPVVLLTIQILDGGAGIFGIVSVLVIADLTRGTGRFNLMLGAATTAVGIGAALSQVIAGGIVHHIGFRAGFLFLAAVAMAAFSVLYAFRPETITKKATRA